MQSTKESLAKLGKGDWHTKIARFLLAQHTTSHLTTSRASAELRVGRRLHTCLDKLHPEILRNLQEKQEKMVEQRAKSARKFDNDKPVCETTGWAEVGARHDYRYFRASVISSNNRRFS